MAANISSTSLPHQWNQVWTPPSHKMPRSSIGYGNYRRNIQTASPSMHTDRANVSYWLMATAVAGALLVLRRR
jgi:MYXO-CTERM domain-containing protein